MDQQYKEKIEATLRAIEGDGAIIFIRPKRQVGIDRIEKLADQLNKINSVDDKLKKHTFLVIPHDLDVLVANGKLGDLQDIMIEDRKGC